MARDKDIILAFKDQYGENIGKGPYYIWFGLAGNAEIVCKQKRKNNCQL